MLNRIAKSALNTILYRAMPPATAEEQVALRLLRETFLATPLGHDDSYPPSRSVWLKNEARLRDLAINADPRRFLRWDVVSDTMFVTLAPYTSTELRFLRGRPDWVSRWKPAIQESSVGDPTPCIFYPTSSANLIHHAYHVAQFEDRTGVRVADLSFVFEFGGGYGSMCRLFHTLGFRGTYVIFDLPSFSALQQYYLTTLGFRVRTGLDEPSLGDGVWCVSCLEAVRNLVQSHCNRELAAFVGTWSISESPMAVRDAVRQLTANISNFLIGYQDQFGEIDNRDYFASWQESRRDVTWDSWAIRHLPCDRYLIGRRITALGAKLH